MYTQPREETAMTRRLLTMMIVLTALLVLATMAAWAAAPTTPITGADNLAAAVKTTAPTTSLQGPPLPHRRQRQWRPPNRRSLTPVAGPPWHNSMKWHRTPARAWPTSTARRSWLTRTSAASVLWRRPDNEPGRCRADGPSGVPSDAIIRLHLFRPVSNGTPKSPTGDVVLGRLERPFRVF